ncbi:DnaD domain protein [Salinicoccus sp. CNSTN-B1]
MNGWISLHRQIKDHWIWEDPQKLKWWIDMLLRTNHKDNKTVIGNKIVVIERSSFHTSEVKLSEQWNVSRNTVRKFLKLLESDEMITTKRTKHGTTVKVLHYNDYQGFSEEKKQQSEQKNEQNIEQHREQNRDNGVNRTVNTNNNDNNANNVDKLYSAAGEESNSSYEHVDKVHEPKQKTNTADLLNKYGMPDNQLGNKDRMELFEIHEKVRDKYFIQAIEKAKAKNAPTANYVLGILRRETEGGKLTYEDLEKQPIKTYGGHSKKKSDPLADVRHYANSED